MKGFFVGCNEPMWIGLLENLQRHNWEFAYVSGTSLSLSSIRDDETLIKHDIYHAERGILPTGVNESMLAIIDEHILGEYLEAETICMDIASRMDMGYTFSYVERQRLYIRVLSFWLYMVERYKPDFVIFQQVPHSVDSYALYSICRKQGISMLCYQPITPIELIIPIRDYADGLVNVTEEYNRCLSNPDVSNPRESLPEYLLAYMQRLTGDYDGAIPGYLKQRLDKEKAGALSSPKESFISYAASRVLNIRKYSQYTNTLFQRGKTSLSRFLSILSPPSAPDNYLKQPWVSLEQSWITGKEWYRHKQWAKGYKADLADRYQKLCTPFDSNDNYIYAALHYQPERTSSPEAGRFSNQVLMISMLSKCVPENWRIVVKENPTQLLSQSLHGERGRYPYFYDDLVALDNVDLVPLDTPPFDLVDNAQAVATLTGTTGWEACVRGKPVIIFGQAWYKGCEGVFHCASLSDCENAMKLVIEGFIPDIEKVYLFLHCLNQFGFRGFLNPKRFSDMEEGVRSNIQHLTQLSIAELEPSE